MVIDTMAPEENDRSKTEQTQKQPEPPQQPSQPQQQPKTLDLRQDPVIGSAVREIQQNAAPLEPGERPVLTSLVVVPGQVSNVQDTKLIDASGAVSSLPFTGTIQPIAYIPLDQGCNIIPSGNGVVATEQVVTVRGSGPTTTGTVMPPPNGVFMDIQSIPRGMATIEIKQGVRVAQGRIQIDTGPNQVIKDAGAGTITFVEGPQKKRVLP
jgi:hypothetical protein